MRFATSPLHETVVSLRLLRDPGLSPLHLPWRRSVLGALGSLDTALLLSLVAGNRALPDFLTPPPPVFDPAFPDELAVVRQAPADLVRRDLLAAHAPGPLPEPLRAAAGPGDAVLKLRDAICAVLGQYHEAAVSPWWAHMRLVLEADMTYRGRQLAKGGARLLFADMHPNLSWRDGVLRISQMIGAHDVTAPGQGLILVPSVFAHKPAPPVSPDGPPLLCYPSRGTATLWARAPVPARPALAALIGVPRTRLLSLLGEPLATAELARRTGVTPSAVSQHLQVLYAAGWVTRSRAGRQVLYRRAGLADGLLGEAGG
jgi:DNA-binding transcriptional ArsR family regulator